MAYGYAIKKKLALGAAEIIYKMRLKLPLQYELTHLQYAVHFAKRSE